MDVRRAYCSAVDRTVPVTLREGLSLPDRLTVTHPAALTCLEYPTRCTGWCCPLHAAEEARVEEAARTARPRPEEDRSPNRSKRWSRPT